MGEITPVLKPPQEVGDFDWSRAPDSLFTNAFNLASRAKQNPVVGEGLQMLMSLKRKETIIIVQEIMIEHEEKHIKEQGEDAMFTKRGLANNREKLRRYEADIIVLLEDYETRKSENPALQEAYSEIEASFNQMLCLINPQWQEMDIGAQAYFQSGLLKLLDFYLKPGQ